MAELHQVPDELDRGGTSITACCYMLSHCRVERTGLCGEQDLGWTRCCTDDRLAVDDGLRAQAHNSQDEIKACIHGGGEVVNCRSERSEVGESTSLLAKGRWRFGSDALYL